jgi:hypothetical protein
LKRSGRACLGFPYCINRIIRVTDEALVRLEQSS